jgi:hypothetical protein
MPAIKAPTLPTRLHSTYLYSLQPLSTLYTYSLPKHVALRHGEAAHHYGDAVLDL